MKSAGAPPVLRPPISELSARNIRRRAFGVSSNAMSVPADQTADRAPPAGIRAVPRTVIALGLVSLFMDTSSEIIHSLLPVFLVSALGASPLFVGMIKDMAEATNSITKIFSGAISDWVGKRKFLILLGYGLAALTKPLFPLASGAELVLVARFVDRIGKGIRGAPRDALIADVTPVKPPGPPSAYANRWIRSPSSAHCWPCW